MNLTAKFILSIQVAILLSSISLGYSGGSGTVTFPYQIGTKADLQTLAATPTDYAKYFILTTDIDLTGETFTRAVIAPDTTVSSTFQGTPFTGVFDGAGYVISNLNITTTTGHYVGLFGYVGSGGQITNLGLEDVTVTGYQYVAGLCGYNASGAIEQCYVTGSITATYYYVGPLCGYNDYGIISQCYAHAAVAGGACAGGVLGDNYCGTVSQCYAAGTVTGTSSVSGICGYQYGTPALIENCFWDTDTSGLTSGVRQSVTYPGTIVNVVGKTTAQMQTQSTFTAASWDFSDTDGDPADWTMPNNDYPKLAYQIYSGGTGTENDPYQISNIEDLMLLGRDTDNYDKNFVLTADIDLTGKALTAAVIASDKDDNIAFEGVVFSGVFDGNRHVISNLSIDTQGQNRSFLGLFGVLENGTIKRLGLENISVTCGDMSISIGTLAGLCRDHGNIEQCYASGVIYGGASPEYLGGLSNVFGGTISNCYADVDVYAGEDAKKIGGFAGSTYGELTNCYACGHVDTKTASGGFGGVSIEYLTFMHNCYFLSPDDGGGLDNGIGVDLTDIQMRQWASFANWDFANKTINETAGIWRMCTDGVDYPRLNWESCSGDFTCPDGVAMEDFAYLSNHWLRMDCAETDDCEGADLNFSGEVEITDFVKFIGNWLEGM